MLLFATLLGGGASFGYAGYRMEVASGRRHLQRQLEAVGRLKAREIAGWLAGRRESLLASASGPRIALLVDGWRERGRTDPAELAWIGGRLENLRLIGDLVDVAIVDRDGRVLVAASGAAGPLRSLDLGGVRRALDGGGAVVAPLQRPAGPTDPAIVLDVVAPLTAVDGRGSRTVGALVHRVDARKALFPLIQSWPTDSPSAEALLVMRDGDQIRYLNDLRHRSDTALRMTVELAAPRLLAAQALRGAAGILEGVDYRGVPSLGHAGQVEGTPWVLISKVDRAEVYAPLTGLLWIFLVLVGLLALAAGLVARTWQRRVAEVALRREHEAATRHVAELEAAERERAKLIESLRKALDEVKTLSGIIPICAACKRVRDDAGFWEQVEAYVSRHSEARFSHGLCLECARKLYPDFVEPEAPPKPEP
ncbi:MAG: cache domain-containing protein [Deltaproteobacteria bacterium]|nr:cache domain-containing protein [Deltaproteobacteria bacterium]